jgi:hypothetical protein
MHLYHSQGVIICARNDLKHLVNINGHFFDIRHSEDRASWYILITEANGMHYFSILF